MSGMKKGMNKKTAAELVMGMVLIVSMVCFYGYSQDIRIGFAKELSNNGEKQAVHFRMDEEDWSIPDMWEYYSSLSYISQERFALQQCGKTNELLYCAVWTGCGEEAVRVPMGLQVTGVTVLDTLPEDYMAAAQETFSKEDGRTGVCNWNQGVIDPEHRDEQISRERLEELTQYVLVDVALYNPLGKELTLTDSSFCLRAVDELGLNCAKTAEGYHSNSASGKHAMVECDQPLDYAGIGSNAEGKVVYYRQPAKSLDAVRCFPGFYVEQEMHMKFLYILTNEELADDNLAFCSLRSRGGEGKMGPSNEGFVVRLQEEIAYDAQDDAAGAR